MAMFTSVATAPAGVPNAHPVSSPTNSDRASVEAKRSAAVIDPIVGLSHDTWELVLNELSRIGQDEVIKARRVSRRWRDSIDRSAAAWSRFQVSTFMSGAAALRSLRWCVRKAASAPAVVKEVDACLTENYRCGSTEIAALWAELAQIIRDVTHLKLHWDSHAIPDVQHAACCLKIENLKITGTFRGGCFDLCGYLLHPDADRLEHLSDNIGHRMTINVKQASSLTRLTYRCAKDGDCLDSHPNRYDFFPILQATSRLRQCELHLGDRGRTRGEEPGAIALLELKGWRESGWQHTLAPVIAPRLSAIALGPNWDCYVGPRGTPQIRSVVPWDLIEVADFRGHPLDEQSTDGYFRLFPRLTSLRTLIIQTRGPPEQHGLLRMLDFLGDGQHSWPSLTALGLDYLDCSETDFCWKSLQTAILKRFQRACEGQSVSGAWTGVTAIERLVCVGVKQGKFSITFLRQMVADVKVGERYDSRWLDELARDV